MKWEEVGGDGQCYRLQVGEHVELWIRPREEQGLHPFSWEVETEINNDEAVIDEGTASTIPDAKACAIEAYVIAFPRVNLSEG